MRNGRFLPAVLALVGTATLWGHNSKTFLKTKEEYRDVLEYNRKKEEIFAIKCSNVACQEKTLKNAIDSMVDGIRFQMGRDGTKEGNLAIGIDCVNRMTAGSEVIKIDTFARAIDLCRKNAHEKIRGELLYFKTKIADYFEQMLSGELDSKVSSSNYFSRKNFIGELSGISNRRARLCYVQVVDCIQSFKQQLASQNPHILDLEDQVFGCLCEILDLTNPDNYARKVEDAIREGLAAIDEEIREEAESLEQQEMDDPEEYRLLSDSESDDGGEEEQQTQAPVLTPEELEKRRECELGQTVLFEYYAAKKQLDKLSEKIPDDAKTIRKVFLWQEELEDIASSQRDANSGQLTRKLMEIARIRRAAQRLESKLPEQKNVSEMSQHQIEQQKAAHEKEKTIREIISVTNALMKGDYFARKKSKSLYNKSEEEEYNQKIGQLRLKLRDNPSLDQLEILSKLAKQYLFEAEDNVNHLNRYDELSSKK